MATYQVLHFLLEGTAHHRGRLSIEFLQALLNDRNHPATDIAHAADKAESELAYVNGGGGCTRGIGPDFQRAEPRRATTAILVYASDDEGQVHDRHAAVQAQALGCADALVIDRSPVREWRARWITPESQ